MFLRRLGENLRTQNWTAIAIELVIVVLGVYLGMQAQDWSNERQARARAADYGERLMDDFREELWFRSFLLAYYRDVRDNDVRVLAAIEGTAPMDDEALLVAAYRATQYIQWSPRRSTYAELVASGGVELVRDAAVRDQAMLTFGSELPGDLRQEGNDAEFRREFRRMVALDVQRNLARNCGDRFVPRELAKLAHPLDYPCDPQLTPAQTAAAAAAIRKIDGLAPMLRLRAMQIQTREGALETSVDNIRKVLQEQAQPLE